MKADKIILVLLFVLCGMLAYAQSMSSCFDSVVVDYRNNVDERYYKYTVTGSSITVMGENHITKRFIEDSLSRKILWVKEVQTSSFQIGRTDIADSLTTMLCSLYNKEQILPQKCDGPFIETEKQIIDFTFFNSREMRTVRIIEEPNCDYDNSVTALINLLCMIQHYPDILEKMNNRIYDY